MILALIMTKTELKNPLATHKLFSILQCAEDNPWNWYSTIFQASIDTIFDKFQQLLTI